MTIGQRVQTHPCTDAWMQGDRYGTIVGFRKGVVRVKLDRSGRIRRFHPDNLLPVWTDTEGRSLDIVSAGVHYNRERWRLIYIEPYKDSRESLSLFDWPGVLAAQHRWMFNGVQTH